MYTLEPGTTFRRTSPERIRRVVSLDLAGAVCATSLHPGAYCLTSPAASLDGVALGLMHIPSLAADIGFVNLNLTRHPAEITVLHSQADAVEHEPSCLLGDPDGPMDFVGANAVLGIGNHPNGRQPFGPIGLSSKMVPTLTENCRFRCLLRHSQCALWV